MRPHPKPDPGAQPSPLALPAKQRREEAGSRPTVRPPAGLGLESAASLRYADPGEGASPRPAPFFTNPAVTFTGSQYTAWEVCVPPRGGWRLLKETPATAR
jgi:hypothetical protein